MSRLATWLPPIVWTAVVLSMSFGSFSAENTGSVFGPLLAWLLPWLSPEQHTLIHVVARKGAHLTEYALLAALWFRGFSRSDTARPAVAAWLAFAIAVICAVVDESHQATVPSRTGSPVDVMIDTLGALVAVVPARLGWVRATDLATGVLLWMAALGGLGALALNLAVGAGGGLLWVTVPIAAVALIYRRRPKRAPG